METSKVIPILYQDDDIIAVHKPEGLLVHKSEIDKHETQFLLQQLRDQIGQKVYPVHRLDKPTSGIIVFGLNTNSQRALSLQFENNKVEKHYLALVRGHTRDQGSIRHPLKEKAVFKSQNKEHLATKDAVTHYRTLQQFELPVAIDKYPTSRYSLVLVAPETGRRQQIRRHMKHIAHPIIGDTSYGKTTHNQYFRTQLNCRRLLLHATRLTFCHPVGQQILSLECPLDSVFEQTIELLNKCSNRVLTKSVTGTLAKDVVDTSWSPQPQSLC
jgi:tRNA pseudouridine65 synthase